MVSKMLTASGLPPAPDRRGWVVPTQGVSASSGRSSAPARPHRSPRLSGPSTDTTASSSTSSSRCSSRTTWSGMLTASSSRTTAPKRRRRSYCSTATRRSSASSSATSMSASRVTRKGWASTTTMPGKSWSRCAMTTCSSGTNVEPSASGTKRGRMSGTLTRANSGRWLAGSRTVTASDSDRLEMYGKGWPGSTASGVSTGKTWSWKYSRRYSRSDSSRLPMSATRVPCSARAGTIWSRKQRASASMAGTTCLLIASSVSVGVQPSEPRLATPASTCSRRPDTRTMKNSSRLLEKIARNLSRSSSGVVGSVASASTRSLNCSQETSRFRYRYGSVRSQPSGAACSAAASSALVPVVTVRDPFGEERPGRAAGHWRRAVHAHAHDADRARNWQPCSPGVPVASAHVGTAGGDCKGLGSAAADRSDPVQGGGDLAVQGVIDEPERRRAKAEQGGVEALVRVARAPCGAGAVAEGEDLDLPPGVPTVGGVEGGPRRLGTGGGAADEGIGGEAADGLVHAHRARVHPDRDGQPRHPLERLDRDADGEARVVGAEALLEAQLLDVVRPALGERLGMERATHVALYPAQAATVGEVPGSDLVHGDGRQAEAAEHLEPLLLLLGGPGGVWRGDVVARGSVVLIRRGPRHHRQRPAARRRRRADQALAVEVGHQPVVAGERDRLCRHVLGLPEHTGGVGVVARKLLDDLGGRAAGRVAVAGVGQHRAQPVPLGVGALLEPAEVDRQRLLRTEQPLEIGPAERRIGLAVAGAALDVVDQAGVGRHGTLGRRVACVQVGGQAAHGRQQRVGHRRADPVEGGDGGGDRLWPQGQVAAAGLGTLLGRRVLAVVAGQVERVEVEQGIATVHLEVAEFHLERSLEGGGVGLVERVVQPRPTQARQAGAHAVRREVLHAAVVLVQADEFACRGKR